MSLTEKNFVTTAVEEFHEKFQNEPNVETRATLVKEECRELIEAMANVFKEIMDVMYVVEGFNQLPDSDLKNQFKADLLLDRDVATAYELGIALSDLVEPIYKEAFLRVHLSNMSKLGKDGKPIRREDGKVLKGPFYKPPVLDDLVGQI
jgi:predicted HAD superfamily Cof-like phosphohydrolase